MEKQLDLYRYKVWGIPLWNVIRYKTRRQYLYKETGIDERATAKSPKNIKGIIKYSCLSLKQFIHFTTKKHFIDNLIIGFSRLEKVSRILKSRPHCRPYETSDRIIYIYINGKKPLMNLIIKGFFYFIHKSFFLLFRLFFLTVIFSCLI